MRIEKPWGWYLDIERTPQRVTKILCVKPGHRLSLQRHKGRDEHWLALEGSAWVEIGSTTFSMARGGPALVVPVGWTHRIHVPEEASEPFFLYEIQLAAPGHVCSEDDIERLEDDYSRG